MATCVTTCRPLAPSHISQLRLLTNIQNCQNGMLNSSAGKRPYSPSFFEDDFDSENINPSAFNSPTKRFKTSDGPLKPSQFMLTPVPQSAGTSISSIPSGRISTTPVSTPVCKALPLPNVASSTPISLSRGSPKHKRVGLLS